MFITNQANKKQGFVENYIKSGITFVLSAKQFIPSYFVIFLLPSYFKHKESIGNRSKIGTNIERETILLSEKRQNALTVVTFILHFIFLQWNEVIEHKDRVQQHNVLRISVYLRIWHGDISYRENTRSVIKSLRKVKEDEFADNAHKFTQIHDFLTDTVYFFLLYLTFKLLKICWRNLYMFVRWFAAEY